MTKNEVLLQRSITALFFGFVVIGLIVSGKSGAILLGLIIAISGGYEYGKMVFPSQKLFRFYCPAVITLAILAILCIPPDEKLFFALNIASIASMLLGIIHLYKPFINHSKSGIIISVLYLGLPFGLFTSYLHHSIDYSSSFWLFVLVLIWMSDSFAYLVGSRIGKRKLMATVSPGKSWEGFLGAGAITLPLAYWIGSTIMAKSTGITDLATRSSVDSGIFWMLIAGGVWIIGTWGDLAESSLKRSMGVKDSGNILPGHGGILDRFDSFIYILPFILFLLQIFSN